MWRTRHPADSERRFDLLIGKMSAKKAYPLRINAQVLDAVQHWADDELRSLNAQLEYVLRESLKKTGRLPKQQPLESDP